VPRPRPCANGRRFESAHVRTYVRGGREGGEAGAARRRGQRGRKAGSGERRWRQPGARSRGPGAGGGPHRGGAASGRWRSGTVPQAQLLGWCRRGSRQHAPRGSPAAPALLPAPRSRRPAPGASDSPVYKGELVAPMVSYNCALDMTPPWLAVTTLSADRGPLQLSDRFPTSAHRTKLAIGGSGSLRGPKATLEANGTTTGGKKTPQLAGYVSRTPMMTTWGPVVARVPPATPRQKSPGEP
jgi:hypothetical protein